jgi:hypothetical protein
VISDIFKWMTLGVILAFGVTVITNGDKSAQVLKAGFGGYNNTLTILAGGKSSGQ